MDEISGLLSQIKFTPESSWIFFQLSMDTIAADNIAYEKTAKVSQDTEMVACYPHYDLRPRGKYGNEKRGCGVVLVFTFVGEGHDHAGDVQTEEYRGTHI